MIFKRKESLGVILVNKIPDFMLGIIDGRIGYVAENNYGYTAFLLDDSLLVFDYGIVRLNSIKLFGTNNTCDIKIDFR